ncbi:hypothetical protein ALNOE001_01040 [Candidatus Methanobinarius endosymbioticus]|uniref:Uncharacterized protein n=1 Tax=Candidatus Methanobinarius endosymbioticus TaxID=2006182 RepID=A0A366MEI5_9EURY|nr:hypothetical protein ALNOE001_01040 [Candidatus Methanobinarius endosymbioticus]
MSHTFATPGNKTFGFYVDYQYLKANTILSVSRILNQVVTETIEINNSGVKTSKLRYTFKNFGEVRGFKVFTIKVNKKYILTGLKTAGDVRYSYNKKNVF